MARDVSDRRTILIRERDPELADLLKVVLGEEGHAVELLAPDTDLLEIVRSRRPDLLLLGLAPESRAETRRLLDDLRADEAGSRCAVLVLTTTRLLADEAIASYNVKGVLLEPFDLSELIEKVDAALSFAPRAERGLPANPIEGPHAWARRILAERSPEALFHWVRTLQTQTPWQGRRDLQLAGLFDSVPQLVEAVAAAIGRTDRDEYLDQTPAVRDRSRAHAQTRHQQGIPLAALVREYTLLREELWDLIRHEMPADVSTDEAIDVKEIIVAIFDRITQTTITAYFGGEESDAERN